MGSSKHVKGSIELIESLLSVYGFVVGSKKHALMLLWKECRVVARRAASPVAGAAFQTLRQVLLVSILYDTLVLTTGDIRMWRSWLQDTTKTRLFPYLDLPVLIYQGLSGV